MLDFQDIVSKAASSKPEEMSLYFDKPILKHLEVKRFQKLASHSIPHNQSLETCLHVSLVTERVVSARVYFYTTSSELPQRHHLCDFFYKLTAKSRAENCQVLSALSG